MLRKILWFFLFLISLVYGTLYAADTLERAIEEEANFIIRSSPRGTVVGIVSIKSGSNLLSEYIMEKLPDYVINNRQNITFVDRSKLDLIQKEIGFQYSGEVSDETMVSIGKIIGARVIVTGTIIEAGNVYNFNIKLLDVESSKILGSNSTQIIHDNVMQSFMSNSGVARMALAEAQQKRQKREAAMSTVKNTLGIFSNGFYLGYIGSLNAPIGISLGWLSEWGSLFIDNEFGPPTFEGYDRSSDLYYIGNNIEGPSVGFTYENHNTAFLWSMIVGLNINIIRTALWTNIGVGLEYRQDYKLYSETSANNLSKIWVPDGSDDKLKYSISAGLYFKLWYFYIQGKYKYIIGEEIDLNTYGLNHLNLGVGYVWRGN